MPSDADDAATAGSVAREVEGGDDGPPRCPDLRGDTILAGSDVAGEMEAEVRRRLESRACKRACAPGRPTLIFACGPDGRIKPANDETAALVRYFHLFPDRANEMASFLAFMGYDVLIRAEG